MTLHYILNTCLIDSQSRLNLLGISKTTLLPLYKGDRIENNHYYCNSKAFLNNLFFNNLKTYLPIFSFYIRKVDKSIRKNSRGKSGKYSII